MWVVLNGRVLSVSIFLSHHRDGELSILTFAGKDTTVEFDMIHPPGVWEKYAPDTTIGVPGSDQAKKVQRSAESTLSVAVGKDDAVANLEARVLSCFKRRTSRFRTIERDSHGVLGSRIFPSLFTSSKIFTFLKGPDDFTDTTVYTCTCTGQDSIFRQTSRLLSNICFCEATVGPETVSGIDERPIEFGRHWIEVAHLHRKGAQVAGPASTSRSPSRSTQQ